MEMHQPSPTRLSHSDVTLSRLDVVYASVPGWLLLLQFAASADLVAEPEVLMKKGRSVHGALLIALRPRRSLAPAQRPIPHWVAQSSAFAERLRALELADGLGGMSPHGRLERHKELIREAAKGARADLLARSEETPSAKAAVLMAAARAVAAGDSRLARQLRDRHPAVREHMRGDGRPQLADARAFASAVAAARFEANRAAEPPEDKKSARGAARCRRWGELKDPLGKRLVLRGIRIRNLGVPELRWCETVRELPKLYNPSGGRLSTGWRSGRMMATGF